MTASTEIPVEHKPAERLDDLAQIIRAYNEVTEKLQQSHELLHAEVARLQRELASTNAQLQRSKRLAALGEMAAGIAHEIRNPLAAIQLYAEMLVQDLPLDTAERDVAGKINFAVRGLESIVSDVLSFSRDMTPRLRKLTAVEVFGRAVEAHRPAIEATAVVVHIDAADTILVADPDLLHQALLNLIRNAVDAMTPDGGTLSLLAQEKAQEKGSGPILNATGKRGQAREKGSDPFSGVPFSGAVVVTVRDTGPGIAEDDIDRIFNPFFTTRNTGTGLGLAIVHRIVDAHGGTIAAHNDRGAVFELTLPTPVSVESKASERLVNGVRS